MRKSAAILIVDDDKLVARSLERHLARTHAVIVAHSVAEARKLLADPARRWSGFLFDVRLEDGSGIDLLEIARRDHSGVPTLIMSAHDDRDPMSQAYVLGSVFVPKPLEAAQRERFLADVIAYESGLDASLRGAVADMAVRYGLTRTETEILALNVLRVPLEEILDECDITYNTYKTHKGSISRKLGAKSLVEGCRRVMRLAHPATTRRARTRRSD